MLEDCDMNKNVLSTVLSRGSMPKADNIARIPDYLDCSVDYLLGRTDNPKSHLAPADASSEGVDYNEYAERIEQTTMDFWAERIAAFKAKRQQDRDKKIQEYLENRSAELLNKLADAKLSDGLEIFDGAELVEGTVQHKGRKTIKQEG
jgi:hypothetical protein